MRNTVWLILAIVALANAVFVVDGRLGWRKISPRSNLTPSKLTLDGPGKLVRLQQKNYINEKYYTEVNFGTPAQTLKLRLATDTSDSWVVTTDCSKCYSFQTPTKHSYYDISQSSSSTTEQLPIWLVGDHIFGYNINDTLQLNDEAKTQLTNYPFFGIFNSEVEFYDRVTGDCDGLLGIGRSSWTEMPGVNETVNLIKHLQESNVIENRLVSMYAKLQLPVPNPEEPNKADQPVAGGEVIIGGIDETLIDGDISYIRAYNTYPDLDLLVDWYFDVNSMKIGDQVFVEDEVGLVTSAEPYITITYKALKIIQDKLKCVDKSEYSLVPNCDYNSMDDITIELDGLKLVLKPEDYALKIRGTNDCRLVFNDGASGVVLGQAFMSKFYTIFDADNLSLGFGTLEKN